MPPADDRPDDAPRYADLGSVIDFAESLAARRGTRESATYSRERAAAGVAEAAGVPSVEEPSNGLSRTAVQLAHALEALYRIAPREYADGSLVETARLADRQSRGCSASEAQRLVALALSSVAGAADLSVPAWTRGDASPDEVADAELESVFVDYDTARDAWEALPSTAETWSSSETVDRYIVAEHAVLNLADARPEVLRRQAWLLLGLVDQIADQVDGATANAVANVAQGLLLQLDT